MLQVRRRYFCSLFRAMSFMSSRALRTIVGTGVVKVYIRHRCGRTHKTPRTFLRCAMPRATIHGDGQYATICRCRYPAIVLLSQDEDRAIHHLASECDSGCHFFHETVTIDLTQQTRDSYAY